MKKSEYNSYDDLPLFLNAETVAKVLGVSPSSAYELLHEDGFPTLRVDSRILAQRIQLFFQRGNAAIRKVLVDFFLCRVFRWYPKSSSYNGFPTIWKGGMQMKPQVMQYRPGKYRFALPNQIWAWKLKPPAFAVLAYLCWLHSHGDNSSVLEPATLAVRLHMSPAMAAACLDDLFRRGLVAQDLTPTLPLSGGRAGCFFTLPHEIFCLDLGHGAITVYAYLLCCENRRTHQCHPSYNTIPGATGLAVNTVMKHVVKLAERKFITVERTSYVDNKGMKWNGNNCYTILPIRTAVEAFHRKQLEKLEEAVEQEQIAGSLAEQVCPAKAPCAPS